MRIGWYAGCTVMISILSLAGFTGWMMPQWRCTTSQPPPVPKVVETDHDGTVAFPMSMEGTTLVAESLAIYEGYMIESDSDVFLVDAAALELKNTGERRILGAEIQLKFKDRVMTFYGTNIPAGAHILIVEQSGAAWTDAPCIGYSCEIQYEDEMEIDPGLELFESDDTTLTLKNISSDVKKDIWIYYKNYLADSGIYIGGITYLVQIESINPNETVQISPNHYVRGYSRVVKIVVLG